MKTTQKFITIAVRPRVRQLLKLAVAMQSTPTTMTDLLEKIIEREVQRLKSEETHAEESAAH
jgi:hypothetical protein